MNGKDKQDLELVLHRLNQADIDRKKIHEDIKFIKDNLFNPHSGLWAETKKNTTFRVNSTKWRTLSGGALITIIGKWIYDILL